MLKRKNSSRVDELRALAGRAAAAALTTAPGHASAVLDAAEKLNTFADTLERKDRLSAVVPAVITLPVNATAEELRTARRRQSTKRGTEVYLPSWSAMAQGLPNAFFRSALFSAGRSVQAGNDLVLEGDQTRLVANKEIATFQNTTLSFSGYELCQFDRQVYSACLDYYRETPLVPEACPRNVRTTFYAFAKKMGSEYSTTLHKALKASLLRLSFAQMRMRVNRFNLEVPKLLSLSFEDGVTAGDYSGSDMLLLRVTESVAELFGPGAWTAVESAAVDYDGLKGWLASFYASHSGSQWLPVETLYRLTGYGASLRDFKKRLKSALDKLKHESTPECSRVAEWHLTQDETRVLVIRAAWGLRRL